MSHVVVGLCALLLGVLIGLIVRRPRPDGEPVQHGVADASSPEATERESAQADDIEALRSRAAEYRALLSKRDAMVAERDRYLAELEGRLRATEAEVMSLRMRSADSVPAAKPQPVFAQNPSMVASNPLVARSGRGTMPVVPPNRRGTPIAATARPPAEVDPADLTQEAQASHALLATPLTSPPPAAAPAVSAAPTASAAPAVSAAQTASAAPAVSAAPAASAVPAVSAAPTASADESAEDSDATGDAATPAVEPAQTSAVSAAPGEVLPSAVVPAAVPPTSVVPASDLSSGASLSATPESAANRESAATPESAAAPSIALESPQPLASVPMSPAPDSSDLASAASPAADEATASTALATDDLTEIVGIGPKLALLLADHGIVTFAALAALEGDDRAALETELGAFRGRIDRDDWIGQARALSQSSTSA